MEDFWDEVYIRGRVYGEEPSLCAIRVNDVMKKRLGLDILDIGCGYARDIRYLTKEGYNCFGIDSSGVAITMALKNAPTADFKFGSFTKIPYPSDSFDCVMSNLTYHLLKKEQRKKALSEVNRVLRKEGILVFTVLSFNDPISQKERGEYGEYSEKFNRSMIEREFSDFEIEKIEEIEIIHKHAKGKKHLHKILLIIAKSKKHSFI